MEALYWLTLNLISTVALAFYSMTEMACVSINKARLHFWANKGLTRALLLERLLKKPSRLFGTTLVGVNIATVLGSECSREFHAAIGLSPDWAPLSQVPFVILFGELAPMFAARHYAENVAMLGSTVLYFCAKAMAPFLWLLSYILKVGNRLLGGKEDAHDPFLSEEEVQKMLEEHLEDDESSAEQERYNFNAISANIFRITDYTAAMVMGDIKDVVMLPSDATIAQLRRLLKKEYREYIPLYHRKHNYIVAIAYPRDLLRAAENRRVRDYSHSSWFVTTSTPVMDLLKQFRNNNERVAIIIDDTAKAVGVVTLNDIVEEIFGAKGQGTSGT